MENTLNFENNDFFVQTAKINGLTDMIADMVYDKRHEFNDDLKETDDYKNFEDTLTDDEVYTSLVNTIAEYKPICKAYNKIYKDFKEKHTTGYLWRGSTPCKSAKNSLSVLRDYYVTDIRNKKYEPLFKETNKRIIEKEVRSALIMRADTSGDTATLVTQIVKDLTSKN